MMQYEAPRSMTNTLLLFGTPVFMYDVYSNPNEVHDTSAEQVDLVQNRDGNFSSKISNVLELDSYVEIRRRILEGLNEYIKNALHIQDKFEFYLTQSWLNINPPGAAHHRHNHSNSIISGVYYIDTDQDSNITFLSSNNTNITSNPTLQIDVSQYTLANATSWTVPVRNNDILYFPSTLLHEVAPNQSNKNRISLAFNCFIKGHFGNPQNLNELKL
jgi:uncharacterized protein (TIGR02466 family)